MRGAHLTILFRVNVQRIIPAYAGSTSATHSGYGQCRDHPRVCGEHAIVKSGSFVTSGSSPRMRGARVRRPVRGSRTRIIPAYAGSTNAERAWFSVSADHPRVCGEHVSRFLDSSSSSGSSPRMRGAHGLVGFLLCLLGIIPAYAGSTVMDWMTPVCSRDHPRVCGEHGDIHGQDSWLAGSSPRMRGALPPLARCRALTRIIPAYAGSTTTQTRRVGASADHPRVCGEHCAQHCHILS